MSSIESKKRKGGGRNISENRARYLRKHAAQASIISGPGLFFTCTRGKESFSVYELKDLLERVAEELKIELKDDERKENKETEEEEEEEEDIEAQINKELKDFKSSTRSNYDKKILNNNNEDEDDDDDDEDDESFNKKIKRINRFESKKMDCECLGFIKFPKSCDPVKFSYHIIESIKDGKSGYGLRFIQRITPVTMTCSASSIEDFERLSFNVLEPHFGIKFSSSSSSSNSNSTTTKNNNDESDSGKRVGLRFRIESIVRCHDKPLNRSKVIQIVGDTIKKFNEDNYISSIDEDSLGHDPLKLKHRVDINNSEIVVLVSVYRYVVGISVVKNYDKDGKRFNLQSIAQDRERNQSCSVVES